MVEMMKHLFPLSKVYIPKLVDETLKKFKFVVGNFTMQDYYEKRNKESKNTLQRFSINKGNIVDRNMNRL